MREETFYTPHEKTHPRKPWYHCPICEEEIDVADKKEQREMCVGMVIILMVIILSFVAVFYIGRITG